MNIRSPTSTAAKATAAKATAVTATAHHVPPLKARLTEPSAFHMDACHGKSKN